MTDLNEVLSTSGFSIDLFSNQPPVHWFLQTLFNDYVSFCTRCLYQLQTQTRREESARKFALLIAITLFFTALVQARQLKTWSHSLILVTLVLCCLITGSLYLGCTYQGYLKKYITSNP